MSAIIASGDGDFSCLVDFLLEKEMFKSLIIPNRKYCSHLLKRKNINMSFLGKKHITRKIQKSGRA